MDTPSAGIYAVLLILLLFSAFFSAAETAVSSVNRVRLKTRADKGDKPARRALRNAEDYDKTLSAILIGNNIVNIGMASLSTVVATALLGESGAAVATVLTTVLVLLFGEILPKSLAKDHAEGLSIQVAVPLAVLKTVLTPVIWVFVQIKRLFTRRKNNELNVQPSVTEDELKTILDTVEEEGVLHAQETDIMQSAIEFDNTTVQEILVPRVDMAALPITASPQQVIALCVDGGYSRVPVYEGSTDNIIGAVYAKDLLRCMAKGTDIRLKRLLREVMYVYRTKKISALLADFRREKQHMAIVTDDYGGTLGLVTLEDVLEELVGEIWDETDKAEQTVQKLADGQYLVAGDENIDEALEAVACELDDRDGEYATVAGWVLSELEHIPQAGESFESSGMRVTVTDVRNKRINKVQIEVLPKPEED